MKYKLLVACALFLVTTICVTCGDETAGTMNGSDGEIQIAKDIDLFKYECDISKNGKTIRIAATNEVVVCQYDEYLEDWSWSHQK